MKKKAFLIIESMLLLSIILSSTQFVHGIAVGSYQMCRDVDPDTWRPISTTTIFLSTEPQAVLWVNLTDVSYVQTAKWRWYRTDGSFYADYSVEVPEPPSGMFWRWIVVYGSMNIHEYEPEEIPGTWSVKFYLNNTLQFSTSFDIMSSTAAVDRIIELSNSLSGLQSNYEELDSTYNSLSKNFTTLTSTYNSLRENYNTLDSEYNSLESDLNTLNTKYNNLNTTYNSLRSEFNTLKANYDATLNDLNNTRNIMYLTVITTIVFVITTIFFAMRKPKG